jgi:hypothetical protein
LPVIGLLFRNGAGTVTAAAVLAKPTTNPNAIADLNILTPETDDARPSFQL